MKVEIFVEKSGRAEWSVSVARAGSGLGFKKSTAVSLAGTIHSWARRHGYEAETIMETDFGRVVSGIDFLSGCSAYQVIVSKK